jgi:plastocyanin
MKKAAAVLALALASVALVACGSSNSTTTTPQSGGGNAAAAGGGNAAKAGGGGAAAQTTVKLETDPSGQLKYTTDSLSAKSGNVTIDLDNTQALSHDVAVENSSGTVLGKSDLIAQGSTSVTLDNLKSGTYTYFCTVPGHRQAGMQGTLTVK